MVSLFIISCSPNGGNKNELGEIAKKFQKNGNLIIDKAMSDWQTAGTAEEGQAAATAFQKAYCEEVPYVSTVTRNAVFAKRNNVNGWQPTLWNPVSYTHLTLPTILLV